MSHAPVLAEDYQGDDRRFAEATDELNRQVAAGTSWSGNERNNVFLNLGRRIGDTQAPDFAEISALAGFDLPDGEYDTVAGLVLERLEHIPSVGESFVVDGILIEVLGVDGFAIQRLQLRVDPAAGLHRRL